ncbi:MAG: hypothetical protein R3A46_12535 [Thermomicrobiales bacterium]
MAKLIALPSRSPVHFRDVLDNDGINDEPLTINATLRRGKKAIIDYTGSSPQCEDR